MSEISKLEMEVLQRLYKYLQETGQRKKWPTLEIFKELGIKDGTYVGTLSESKFLEAVLDNTQDCFQITNEGIRFMDNLKSQQTQSKSKSRKSIREPDLKILWGRAANRCSICKKVLVHEKTGNDPDVVVGIHSHIIADSPDGPRGQSGLPLEKRHLYDNLILVCMDHSKIIDEQLEKYTVEELHRIKNEHEAWISERLSPIEEVIGKLGTPTRQQDIPVLDLESMGGSGGPNGHFLTFKITNMSQTQRAIDCQWEVRGFNYSFRAPDSDRFSLQPNYSKEVTYRFDTEKLYQTEVPELSLVMEYKDINGNIYFTRRQLNQVRVPSGAFYTLERGGIFYPAEQISDIGIKGISYPDPTGDRKDALFEVDFGGKNEFVNIGISGTFLGTWGMGNADSAIKSALAELGQRMIKKMKAKDQLSDYLFVTDNFPQEYQKGLEGYRRLRDSL